MANKLAKRSSFHVGRVDAGTPDLPVGDSAMKSSWIDKGAEWWDKLGNILNRRPIQFILTTVGVIAVVIAFTILFTRSIENTATLHEIREQFCAGPRPMTDIENEKRCNELFDKLLETPTHSQRQKLKELIKSGE